MLLQRQDSCGFERFCRADYLNSVYSYDSAGNLTGIADASDSSFSRTMAYDSINRLTGINGPWGAGVIAYNGAGNITSQVLGGAGLYYNYDGSNRLSSVSGTRATSYAYDAYGNTVSGMGNSYTYDGVPNLRCVNCSDSGNKIEYSYDATGSRSLITKSGVKTYEMYGSNGNQLIEFTPSQSNKLIQYIYLGGKRVAQKESGANPTSTTVRTYATYCPPGRICPTVVRPVVVANVSGGDNLTGSVTFYKNGVVLGTATLFGGSAALGIQGQQGEWQAVYSGDQNYLSSTSPTFIFGTSQP